MTGAWWEEIGWGLALGTVLGFVAGQFVGGFLTKAGEDAWDAAREWIRPTPAPPAPEPEPIVVDAVFQHAPRAIKELHARYLAEGYRQAWAHEFERSRYVDEGYELVRVEGRCVVTHKRPGFSQPAMLVWWMVRPPTQA